MIARLTGRVELLGADRCLIDVHGVGYLVFASTRTLAALADGQEACVLVETEVREDAIVLFGFADAAERDWFRLLTTVQGVGARVALNILSALSVRDLALALASGDRAALTQASGVGGKLALRLISELRERAGAMPDGAAAVATVSAEVADGAAADAVSALLNLGYRRAEAAAAIARAAGRLGTAAALPALIREGLRELAR
jgi:Holliday junction DNA helicase RuvA